MKILLIEDEPLIRKSLKKLLERKGATVTEESTGKKAIEKISTEDFDRIICDLMLKDVTGFDIIEESKKKYSLDEISLKFIIITAYSSPQVIKRASKYGCDLVTKPFRDINSALNIFLNKGKYSGKTEANQKSYYCSKA